MNVNSSFTSLVWSAVFAETSTVVGYTRMWYAQSVVCLIDQENKKRSTDEKVTEREENKSNRSGCIKE